MITLSDCENYHFINKCTKQLEASFSNFIDKYSKETLYHNINRANYTNQIYQALFTVLEKNSRNLRK